MIQQLIENKALHNPDAPAVSWNGKTLSYKTLNEKSNQLAHFLRKEGVKPEMLVGISAERSLEMIIGLLGILKSGGAYVPIDPTYPKERIDYILRDSKLTLLITQKALLPKLPITKNIKTIFYDDNQEIISSFSTLNPPINANPNNLVYMLYTSGSTGAPKGVMVCHKNLIHAYTNWKIIYYLKNTDCHLQMANFSFDVFTGDFVRALCSGAKLVLCPKNILLKPEKLYALIQKEKINCAEFVPTVLRRLIAYSELQSYPLSFMRILVCGSDNWSINEHRKLQNLCGQNTRVINSYGLTETTIDSTYFEDNNFYSPKNLTTNHAVIIGKPFPNTKIFLLDENLTMVPSGEVGEIYIGGTGLSRGYYNQPDLTAQRFIPNPFSSSPEEKLYKTGDKGRYLSDGNIEFLGRIDNQIKLRGMRVELGEIENAINCFPGIRENLVTVSENEDRHKKLIAHIVVGPEKEIDDHTIRQFLRERLPCHMIPSIFIHLDSLPLTPNGKLNRQMFKNLPVLLS